MVGRLFYFVLKVLKTINDRRTPGKCKIFLNILTVKPKYPILKATSSTFRSADSLVKTEMASHRCLF